MAFITLLVAPYYDRTTNVVQWFNTIEEAVAAGYRAPKR
ncbi:sunset domain-containing protein [Carnobacterium sp.]